MSSEQGEATTAFHPFRWEDAEDPFEALKGLRHRCPISEPSFPPLPSAKLFTRYDDLATVFRDWRTFNNIGVSIDVAAWKATPPERQSIISSNPPYHGPKRRLMLNAVTPAPVDRAKPALEVFAKEVVDGFASRGQAEMIAAWAKPIPSAGIAMALGLPVEDCQRHGSGRRRSCSRRPACRPRTQSSGRRPTSPPTATWVTRCRTCNSRSTSGVVAK
jgi:cytochrome P450